MADRSTDKVFKDAEMTPEMVELIAKRAAKEAVKEMMIQMGISADSPIDMQRDMQYLRMWRTSMSKMTTKGMLIVVTTFVAGIMALIITGLKDFFIR